MIKLSKVKFLLAVTVLRFQAYLSRDLMSEELKNKVLDLVKEGDVAVAYVAKKLNIQHMEAIRILEELVAEGKISKRGKRYRIVKAGIVM